VSERPKRPIAIVTGASRGIGRAIAMRLAVDYDIVAVARSRDELDELATVIREAGAQCSPIQLDVTDGDAVASGIGGIAADVLVNNAGVATMKPLLDLAPDEWRTMVDVNFNALYHVTRAVMPGMVARRRGHIVNIGSIAGRSAFIGGSCYAATKAAVTSFSESLMLEVRHSGVRVSVVMPGSVATDLFPEGTDMSWMIEPEDIANAVAYVVSTPENVLVHRLEVRPLAPKMSS
jgi:3-hydroxy acid dehydrogenase / malonic semialdehyde reductase